MNFDEINKILREQFEREHFWGPEDLHVRYEDWADAFRHAYGPGDVFPGARSYGDQKPASNERYLGRYRSEKCPHCLGLGCPGCDRAGHVCVRVEETQTRG